MSLLFCLPRDSRVPNTSASRTTRRRRCLPTVLFKSTFVLVFSILSRVNRSSRLCSLRSRTKYLRLRLPRSFSMNEERLPLCRVTLNLPLRQYHQPSVTTRRRRLTAKILTGRRVTIQTRYVVTLRYHLNLLLLQSRLHHRTKKKAQLL